ncbi:MAG: 4Fe-4S binding protein [Armatimonadota bacterium]|nr:MAG: 4Fe-4S binding protein [Armatimonadota bacterium]
MTAVQQTEERDAERAEWERLSARRRRLQLALWIVVVVTIVGGPFWPLLGFTVPAVTLTAVVGGFFKGRYVCGWLCPRGAFYDRVVKWVSPGRPIPEWMRNRAFRWVLLGLLMGFMVWQISLKPGDVYHWGRVFVRICIITTGLGVVLALLVHPRSWCAFCPMGTLQSAVGGKKSPLYLEKGCVECRSCEQACPMNLAIVGRENDGRLDLPDCVKCSECQLVCPKGLLHY